MESVKINTDIQPARWSDLPRFEQFLGRSFENWALLNNLFPDNQSRERDIAWLQSRGVAHGLLYGTVDTNTDRTGVSVWFGPGEGRMTPIRVLRSGLIWVPCKLGMENFSRLKKYHQAEKKLRRQCNESPHWYLFLVAVDPLHRTHGVGRAMIEQGLQRSDAASLPCYLETSQEENIHYFERFGFELRGKVELEAPWSSASPLWGMVRAPGAPESWPEHGHTGGEKLAGNLF